MNNRSNPSNFNYNPGQESLAISQTIPHEEAISVARDAIDAKLEEFNIELPIESQVAMGRIFDEAARGIALESMNIVNRSQHKPLVFLEEGKTDPSAFLTNLKKLTKNLTIRYINAFLIPILGFSGLPDSKPGSTPDSTPDSIVLGPLQTVFAKLSTSYFLQSLEGANIHVATDSKFNPRDIKAENIDKLVEIQKEMTVKATPRDVAKAIIKSTEFDPLGFIMAASGNYVSSMSVSPPNFNFLKGDKIKQFKLMLRFASLEKGKKSEFYTYLINNNGVAKAYDLGIISGDFNPMSFRAFFNTKASHAVKQANRNINKQIDVSNVPFLSLLNLAEGKVQDQDRFSGKHVSRGHVTSTLLWGVAGISSVTSIGVALAQAVVRLRENKGQTPDQAVGFIKIILKNANIAKPILKAIEGTLSTLAPLGLAVVSAFIARISHEAMANPSLNIHQVLKRAADFAAGLGDKLGVDTGYTPDTPGLKVAHRDIIRKVAFLKLDGFRIMQKPEVIKAFNGLYKQSNQVKGFFSLSDLLTQLSPELQGQFMKNVVGSFPGQATNSDFWSLFVSQYSLLVNQAGGKIENILPLFNNNVITKPTDANAKLNNDYLTSLKTRITGATGPIPSWTHSRYTGDSSGQVYTPREAVKVTETFTEDAINHTDMFHEHIRRMEKLNAYELPDSVQGKELLEQYGVEIDDKIEAGSKVGKLTAVPEEDGNGKFHVVNNLQVGTLKGTITKIRVTGSKLIFEAKGLAPQTFTLQTIAVLPEDPYQKMEGEIVHNRLSAGKVPRTSKTVAANFRYNKMADLKQFFPGIEKGANNAPKNIKVNQYVKAIQPLIRNSKLSTTQYQVLQHLIEKGKVELKAGKLKVKDDNGAQLITFSKAPNFKKPLALNNVNTSFSKIEFIKDGDKRGIFLQNFSDVFDHHPVLTSHLDSDTKIENFDYTMQQVLDALDEKDDDELTPTETLMEEALDDLDGDHLREQFIIAIPGSNQKAIDFRDKKPPV